MTSVIIAALQSQGRNAVLALTSTTAVIGIPYHPLFCTTHLSSTHASLFIFSTSNNSSHPQTVYRSCIIISASSLFASTNAISDPTATTTVATIPIGAPIAPNPKMVKQVYPVKIERYITRKKSKKRSSRLGFVIVTKAGILQRTKRRGCSKVRNWPLHERRKVKK